MPESVDVLLVQPPYLRLFGSHNNRVPLELQYLHRFLHADGIPSRVLNLDKTPASVSIPWSRLYENSGLIDFYLAGDSPLLDESVERVLSFSPKVVVIAGGESLTPWADLGNPYVAAMLSQRLRPYGIFTIGVGPFFKRVPGRFADLFDAIVQNAASPSICSAAGSRRPGESMGSPMPAAATPLIDSLDEWDVANVVMTSVGCPFTCNFCLGAATGSMSLDLDAVVADIMSRPARYLEIGDAVFAPSEARLREVEAALSGLGRHFACELSTGKCQPARLERLRSLGVVQIKLGIESGSDLQLVEMGKRQTVSGIKRAVQDAKAIGLQVTGYVLLGGTRAKQRALETLELCEQLDLDDLVVNVLSHFDLGRRDFSRDAHWSMSLAEYWDVADVMPRFFGMQAREKAGVGRLLPATRVAV